MIDSTQSTLCEQKSVVAGLDSEGLAGVAGAPLIAADQCGSNNRHSRPNGMERGYLRWALNNRALFRAIYHPDVSRQASSRLRTAVEKFADSVQREIKATRLEGSHVNVPLPH